MEMRREVPDSIAFAENLLAILDRGSFTSTYKYAVLLALLDLSLEATQRDGAPPTSVTTRQLAEQVLELYWPQAVPFQETRQILDQNQGRSRRAEIVRFIEEHRAGHGEPSTPHRARAIAPRAFEKLVRDVEWILVENPLPRLQIVGNESVPFLYSIAWDARSVRRRDLRESDFDNSIRFVRGAAEHLVRLGSLLRPLIQREWAAHIARLNGLGEATLEDFLFGTDRQALAPLRGPLVELQRGACFYCGERLKEGSIEIDHFIPRARHPNDAIENLVAADRRCNGAKSDHLAGSDHLARWVERDGACASALAQIAIEACWPSQPGVSRGVARGIYLRVPEDARLWLHAKSFEPARRTRLVDLLR